MLTAHNKQTFGYEWLQIVLGAVLCGHTMDYITAIYLYT